ncbi:MAG: hypothetical protein RLZZ453_197 [Chlamydiota bacterium]|jgi:hypothetical protein
MSTFGLVSLVSALLFSGVSSVVTSLENIESISQEDKQVQSVIEKQYGYVDIGVGPAPLPAAIVGLGYRGQRNHHGYDVSLQGNTMFIVSEVRLNFLYHYYPSPNLESQWYIGTGVAAGYAFLLTHPSCLTLSPQWVFGKEYCNDSGKRTFWQVGIREPIFAFTHGENDYTWIPLVEFTYGFGF